MTLAVRSGNAARSILALPSPFSRRRHTWTGALALAGALACATPAFPWGWIGHRLITRQAIAALPRDVKAVYAQLEGPLEKASVRPDELSARSRAEAIRHFLNPEVLDPSFASVFKSIEAPAKRRGRHGRETFGETPTAPVANPSSPSWPSSSSSSSSPASPSSSLSPSPGASQAAASSSDTGGAHPSWHTAAMDAARLRIFTGRAPFSASDADRVYALVPATLEDAQRRLTPGQQAALGLVVYQPARYYDALVRAFKRHDPAAIVEATGRLSHYVGDLHQPLHNTIDHDGVLSGNVTLHERKGPAHTVHQRFETDLLKFMGPALEPQVAAQVHAPHARRVDDLTHQAIAASREGYGLIASILDADKAVFARLPSSRRIPWKKYNALAAPVLGPIAVRQLARATQMLADLIVTAYREAAH